MVHVTFVKEITADLIEIEIEKSFLLNKSKHCTFLVQLAGNNLQQQLFLLDCTCYIQK